jgi:hypothetical protein
VTTQDSDAWAALELGRGVVTGATVTIPATVTGVGVDIENSLVEV